MGLLRSRKPKDAANEGDDVKQSRLALAPEGKGAPDAAPEETREANAEPTWVRLGGDALWAGVLPDDALASLPSSQETGPEVPANEEAPASSPDQAAAADALALAATRPQEPGSPDFRILCGATTTAEIWRRFSWKTDKELAEAYEIALQERGQADGSGDAALFAYWDALVAAAVTEAANRSTFGELNEWEEEEDRREQRQTAKRLEALAKARESLRRSNSSS
jgi:hypothetical protein